MKTEFELYRTEAGDGLMETPPRQGARALWRHEILPEGQSPKTALQGAPEDVARALTAEETRPCCRVDEHGVILILRGVNFNDPDNPEDMVSLRVWATESHVHSISRQRVRSVEELHREMLAAGKPGDPAGVVAALVLRLSQRLKEMTASVYDELDEFEDKFLAEENIDVVGTLLRLRRRAIWLNRYADPQEDALLALLKTPPPWFGRPALNSLRLSVETTTRSLEQLAAIRDHAIALQDQARIRGEQTSQRTAYILTLVAGVFLPLNLIAGLFGVNIGGMPGLHDPYAFWILTGALVVLGVLGGWWLLRYK